MTGVGDVSVEIFDKTWARIGVVNSPSRLEAVWRMNQASTATVTVPVAGAKGWLLMGEGHRIRIRARGLVWSGWLHQWSLDGIGPSATVTATFASDMTWLEQMLCWPAPGVLPGTLAKDYDRRAGPAETVFKGYVGDAVSRLGLPITVSADQGRGSIIRAELRMHTPADKLLPLLEQAGLRAVLEHRSGQTLTLDVEPIRTYPRALTAQSGVLGLDTTITEDGPTATRIVAGGAGEGAARLFRAAILESAETKWGRVGEAFADMRDLQIDLDDPQMDTQAEVDAAMDARLATGLWERNARMAVDASLSETEWFRVAAGVLEVGDRVPLDITIPTADPGRPVSLQLTETITEAVLSWTHDAGMVVTPVLGRLRDNPQGPLLERVAGLSRRVRDSATI